MDREEAREVIYDVGSHRTIRGVPLRGLDAKEVEGITIEGDPIFVKIIDN